MHELTFATFIAQHAKATDNPEGDFVRDARREIEMGIFSSGNTWDRLESHLIIRRASTEAVEAARNVFHRRYVPWLARRGRVPDEI